MSDQIQQIRNAVKDDKVVFYFVPSQMLKDLILQNTHPIIQDLPQDLKIIFLENMVVSFIEGSLDTNNKFILDNGEIRVVDNNHIRLTGSDLKIKSE